MTSKKLHERLVLPGAAASPEQQQAADAEDRALVRRLADEIKRGKLSRSEVHRELVAAILVAWADRPHGAVPKRRGNPRLAEQKKIADPDRVALLVGARIAAQGESEQAALAAIADELGVDVSTVAKLYRPRREAVARWFQHTNLSHRVGAIRRK